MDGGLQRQQAGRGIGRGTCSQLAADCAQIMHKCNYALCCGAYFDHVEMPAHGVTAMQTRGIEGEGGSLTKGNAIRLLLLVLLLIGLFAAQRLQLDAICGGHFVVSFRHVATAEATT